MKKQILLSAVILGMVSLGVGVSGDPGETVKLNNNSSDVSGSSPFSVYTNANGSFVDLDRGEAAGTYNVSINYSNVNNTVYEEVVVNEFGNWSFSSDSIVTNASVLSGGSVNLSVTGSGNTAETLLLDTGGNLSELNFQVQSPVTTVPGETVSVVNGFSVPRSQDFGWYNGTVNASGQNFGGSDGVNVSIKVFDDIKPSIDGSSFPDVMALQEKRFSVEASDNLEVANVTGSIWFETTERVGNDTVLVNESLTDMSFEKSDTGNFWTYDFVDTDREAEYYYSVTVSDSSGNSESLNGSFEVSRLDSIKVLDSDFEFKDMRPRTDDSPERSVEKEIFVKEFEKDLKLGLSSFTHRKNNSSMSVGIRERSEDNLRFLYRDGELQGNITISGSGTYVLEVFSDSQGDTYSGDLALYPVPQHEELANNGLIRFSGTVVDPEYPELPESRSIGDFEGGMEFILNENGVPTGIRFTGENRDIEGCKGVESWSNCIPGYTLGELPEMQEKVEQWKSEAASAKTWRNIFIFIGVAFPLFSVYNRFGRGTFMVTPKVYKKNIEANAEKEIKTLDDIQTGRRGK